MGTHCRHRFRHTNTWSTWVRAQSSRLGFIGCWSTWDLGVGIEYFKLMAYHTCDLPNITSPKSALVVCEEDYDLVCNEIWPKLHGTKCKTGSRPMFLGLECLFSHIKGQIIWIPGRSKFSITVHKTRETLRKVDKRFIRKSLANAWSVVNGPLPPKILAVRCAFSPEQ